ncbi:MULTISPECIES: KOW motif-containing protein [unclassified Streptomyces]|uniref:KOW motif-containing protein n=1 Tax=unclassified Streptomyces TaxID=2593676 RepID=UPI00190B763F|nr:MULTISPECIES: KOW motif-containing protein [unclassified Streptomyces]MBK3564720.1 KOW motif-containing protein [Streptomyces sp. MBT62]MBK6016797.1 KOW motif-containing protein [Streptomyces sp. MBT53]
MPSGLELQPGDTVLVIDGPFAQLTGPVRALDQERHRVQLIVQIFGDDTGIDVPLDAVERVPDV